MSYAIHNQNLAFNDSVLRPIQQAWRVLDPDAAEEEYLSFPNREGMGDDEDGVYE